MIADFAHDRVMTWIHCFIKPVANMLRIMLLHLQRMGLTETAGSIFQ